MLSKKTTAPKICINAYGQGEDEPFDVALDDELFAQFFIFLTGPGQGKHQRLRFVFFNPDLLDHFIYQLRLRFGKYRADIPALGLELCLLNPPTMSLEDMSKVKGWWPSAGHDSKSNVATPTKTWMDIVRRLPTPSLVSFCFYTIWKDCAQHSALTVPLRKDECKLLVESHLQNLKDRLESNIHHEERGAETPWEVRSKRITSAEFHQLMTVTTIKAVLPTSQDEIRDDEVRLLTEYGY